MRLALFMAFHDDDNEHFDWFPERFSLRKWKKKNNIDQNKIKFKKNKNAQKKKIRARATLAKVARLSLTFVFTARAFTDIYQMANAQRATIELGMHVEGCWARKKRKSGERLQLLAQLLRKKGEKTFNIWLLEIVRLVLITTLTMRGKGLISFVNFTPGKLVKSSS